MVRCCPARRGWLGAELAAGWGAGRAEGIGGGASTGQGAGSPRQEGTQGQTAFGGAGCLQMVPYVPSAYK